MAEQNNATLDFNPESWKEKSESDYSLTEGMEYELFTNRYRELQSSRIMRDAEEKNALESSLFGAEEEDVFDTQREQITKTLFTEVKWEIRHKTKEQQSGVLEGILAAGFLLLLFFVLLAMTFRKKTKTT